jgi:hypothetical protein
MKAAIINGAMAAYIEQRRSEIISIMYRAMARQQRVAQSSAKQHRGSRGGSGGNGVAWRRIMKKAASGNIEIMAKAGAGSAAASMANVGNAKYQLWREGRK